MVPATISDIDNWLPLVQLMGQRFTAYFFELPGHGKSTPFAEPYGSKLVAMAVEDFIHRLGYDRVNLMGFSFGGHLAMEVLNRLSDRIDQVILLAPLTSRRALPISRLKLRMFQALCRGLSSPICIRGFVYLTHRSLFHRTLLKMLVRLGTIEERAPLERKLATITPERIEVLLSQLQEILDLEHPTPEAPFEQPCFFAMSI